MEPAPTRATDTFRNLLIAFAIVASITPLILRPDAGASLITLAIDDGPLLVAWLLGAVGWGMLVAPLTRATLSMQLVTQAALGLGVLSLLTLLLGLAGGLNRFTAIGLVAIGLGVAARRLWSARATIGAWTRTPAEGAWGLLLLAPVVGITWTASCVLPGILWGDEPHGYDVLSYHLMVPREWYEIGRIVPLGHNVFSYFPFNAEVHSLLSMHLRGGPHAGMYLAQMMHAVMAMLVPLAVYGVARQLGAARLVSAGAGVACGTVPWVMMLGAVAYNEGLGMLFGTLAIGWGLVSLREDSPKHAWLLAGATAGLAIGCKYTNLAMVAALLPLAMLGKPPVPHWRRAAGAVAIAMVVVSPWLIRNAIWTGGNPLFPLAASTLGQAHWDDGQVARFERAHAPRDDEQAMAARFEKLWRDVLVNDRSGVVFFLAIGAGIVVLARRDPLGTRLALVLVGMTLVWLLATHLQGRFLTGAIPLAALLVARLPWRGVVAVAIVASATNVLIRPSGFGRLLPEPQVAGAMVSTVPPDALWFGLTAMRELTLATPGFDASVLDSDRPIALWGDAAPFRYDVPTSRLFYRTVFDVPSGPSLRESWLQGAPPDAIVITNESELRRMEGTYGE